VGTRVGQRGRKALLEQYAAHKSWSAKLHHDNLVALAEIMPSLRPVPSYWTVRRFLKSLGLENEKQPRKTAKRTEGRARAEARLLSREVRGNVASHVNGLWHWDAHGGSRSY
jgi:putative transposase